MKKFIELPDVSAWVEAEWVQGKLWVHLFGKTFCIEKEESKSQREKKSDVGGSLNLLAPMPGKVTKLLVSPSLKVKKGDAVLVMEAMKMEYTLKAGGDGQVQSVHCQVGDQVSMGSMLVEVKPEGGSK